MTKQEFNNLKIGSLIYHERTKTLGTVVKVHNPNRGFATLFGALATSDSFRRYSIRFDRGEEIITMFMRLFYVSVNDDSL